MRTDVVPADSVQPRRTGAAVGPIADAACTLGYVCAQKHARMRAAQVEHDESIRRGGLTQVGHDQHRGMQVACREAMQSVEDGGVHIERCPGGNAGAPRLLDSVQRQNARRAPAPAGFSDDFHAFADAQGL